VGRQTGQALQRAQLFDTERRLRHRAEVLQRITAVLAASPDAGEIAAAVVAELVDADIADLAMVALTDADGDQLVPAARRGAGADDPRTWTALGLPANWADSVHTCLSSASSTGGGIVTLPLTVDGWRLGVLVLGYRLIRRLSDSQRAFLTLFADHAARALERASLQRETYLRGRRDAFQARLGGALDEVSTLRDRARRLVDMLVPDLATRAVVDLEDADGIRRVAEASTVDDDAADPAAMTVAATAAIATGKVHWGEGPDREIVALPLRARGNTLGTVCLRALADQPFREADLPFLEDLGYRAGLALDNARLYEHERETAHVLQQSLLSSEAPRDSRVETATRYLPGTEDLEVGGDWYDIFLVRPGRIGIAVGDVVGRGINSATAMGQLRSATRALAGVELGPAGLLEQLDRFVEWLAAARTATLVYAEIDLDTGRMRYSCAGHLPPLLVPPDGEPEHLWDGRSMPLGVVSAHSPRTEAQVTLQPGTRLLLYTDGLVETRDEPLYDRMARLARTLAGQREAPPSIAVRALTDLMLDGRRSADDVCLLCLDYVPPGERRSP
jgi:serine/threonine-protein kinase RsbW